VRGGAARVASAAARSSASFSKAGDVIANVRVIMLCAHKIEFLGSLLLMRQRALKVQVVLQQAQRVVAAAWCLGQAAEGAMI